MARHMRKPTELGLEAITIEGGLIAPEQVAAIAGAARDAKLAASYDVPKGLMLADEVSRYFRIGQGIWRDFAKIDAPTTTQTAGFVRELLAKVFGFDDLVGPREHHDGTRRYRIALEARDGRVPIVVAPPATDERGRPIGFTRALPEFGDGSEGRARRSPGVLLQDWLNANSSFYWGLVFAGDRVRLMRDNASLTRTAWIEADLGAMFRDEMFADFTAWWLLTHASRFGSAGAAPSASPLEQAREGGLRQGTAARERLREGVEAALAQLGQGLIEANPSIREQLATDPAATMRLFEELLRTVYRLIFLAVAEERDLLHPRTVGREARALYEDSYSFAFWRDRSARRAAYDAHHDAWEGMKVTLAALEQGQPLLGLPALGGLFARDGTRTLNAARIPNRRFLAAIWSLGFIEVDSTRTRINWRDMRTEELGSVYESLLEIRPFLSPDGIFSLDAGAKGNARKTSGSYYTPDSLVETLLDSALDPVLEYAEANGSAEAILDLKVIDPACGSGHFLLGAARRMAGRVAALRNPDAPDEQAALRDVVSRCIHGVDRNPMAVELAKVALWIESVSPGQPLGFLDANIRCGDALLGVFSLDALEEGVPDAAYKPLTGDDKTAAKYYAQQNKAAKKGQGQFDWAGGTGAMPPRKLAANLSSIRRMPEDTVAQVEKKREAFEAWRQDPARYATRVACDLYVAAFLLPKTEVPLNQGRHIVPTTADVRARLAGGQVYGPLEGAAIDAAGVARVLHWPLAFPDVMIERGGFDVVLGNPPWERIKLQEQEFFAGTAVADAPNSAERTRRINALPAATLPSGEPDLAARALYAAFQIAKRVSEAMSLFARVPGQEGGRYAYTGTGDVNTYALFAEHFLKLTRERGRAGVIVPTGIATDLTTAPFFDHLMSTRRLTSLIGFENEEFIFPEIHNATKFALLVLGMPPSGEEPDFAFLLRKVEQADDARRHFALSVDDVARLNPNTRTAPIFRSKADAELAVAIHRRCPILWPDRADGNVWKIKFLRMFDMANDSGLFMQPSSLDDELQMSALVPLLEGKMFHYFNHRHGTYKGFKIQPGKMVKELPPPTDKELNDANFETQPRYWIERRYQQDRLRESGWARKWLLGWRDITGATVFRSMICTILPDVAVGHTTPLLLSGLAPEYSAVLVSGFSSIVFDYLVRLKLGGTHLTYSYLRQVPFPPPAAYTESDLAFVVPRVLELTYTSHAMAPFARDLGYDGVPFGWDEDRRAQLRAELDAWFALAYGLSRDELRYVLDPKDVMGADYPSETFRVLQKNEIAKYGEYRTQRLVLAAYDAQAAAAPETATLADGQWQGSIADEHDVRLLLAAIIKRMRQPRALREVIFAFLYAAQPHLLTPRLNAGAATEWQRLVGNAATLPVSQSVPTFSSAHLTHFGVAQGHLAARRAWRYDAAASAVDRSAAIYEIPLPPWAEGRADFVWHALRSIDLDAATSALSQMEQRFVAQAAAA